MLCENCKKRPATVYVRRSINGVTTEAHLCEECARERGELNFLTGPSFTFPDLSLGSLFSSLLDHLPVAPGGSLLTGTTLRCPECGLTYGDFRERGRLGCARCYTTFREQLEPLIRRLQGGLRHAGKVPRRSGGALRVKHDLETLRRRLKEAVSREAFEEAARLRDEIRALEQKLKGGEGGV
ncbi:MAG: protein arginine kinase activator [Bacillota bacterium]|jgi:protein arginine kinase activator|nr:protein arginine kinase activator [Bacillota bacterium]MDK2924981.1 protein arginine kinase activator [Bacillota bacterium]